MNNDSSRMAVNVDVTNPGQFFACCGLLELAHRLWPGAEGWFEKDQFHVVIKEKQQNLFCQLLDRLRTATFESDKNRGEDKIHPICINQWNLYLDWWLDTSGKSNSFKLWAGQQSFESIILNLQAALKEINLLNAENILNVSMPLSGRFGFDPRAAWNAIDVGYSPNEQQMKVNTFPIVEILAAVGIQGFRPAQDKNDYYYSTWNRPLPTLTARIAASGRLPIGNTRTFRFQIVSRGNYKGLDYAIPIHQEVRHE